MNWEALGAVAELMGAIGVIGSLVYLAKEIKSSSDNVSQNTKALISNRDISSNEFALSIIGSQIENADLAALALKGHSKPQDLGEVDLYRYNLLLTAMFESHQTFFVQQSSGSVSPELWDYYSKAFDGFCRFPGVSDWWKQSGTQYNPAFAAYINEKIPPDA